MSELEVILGYKGEFDFETIDRLLIRLKELPDYQAIKRSVQKKVYSTLVECMENIYKHSITESLNINGKTILTFINLRKQDDKYIIDAGNVITNNNIIGLRRRFEQIGQLDRAGLKTLYADLINKEFISDEDGAGLGLITIALKTENKIIYNFTSLNDQYSYFEMNISI
jgi:hypothetical protein